MLETIKVDTEVLIKSTYYSDWVQGSINKEYILFNPIRYKGSINPLKPELFFWHAVVDCLEAHGRGAHGI